MNIDVAAVVVTYNRLPLLQRTVRCLCATPELNEIIIVDNGCTDGTSEWLDAQQGLTVIHQGNTGGSGGFYTGMKYACDAGASWVWCMDDDVYPDVRCLEKLLQCARAGAGILCPRRMQGGKIFVTECRALNLDRPFSSLHRKKLTGKEEGDSIFIQGMTFEGPLVRRDVIEKIGFPNKDLFIFYDDTDYAFRACCASYRVQYVPDAIMEKEPFPAKESWAVRKQRKRWKRLYQVRNGAYFNHHYGKNFFVRYVRSFYEMIGYAGLALCCAPFSKAYRWKDAAQFWRAYRDGIRERLGKMAN